MVDPGALIESIVTSRIRPLKFGSRRARNPRISIAAFHFVD